MYMKHLKIVGIITLLFMMLSGNAFALNTPSVSNQHGVIMGTLVSDNGLMISGEYGLNPDLALIGSLGDPLTRLGIKYELSTTLALTAGAMEQSPFIGLSGGLSLAKNVQGLWETAVYMDDNDIALFYEFGAKFTITPEVDIRGGFIGLIHDRHRPHFQLGVGYRF